jgi:CRISPR-associated endoribonuclease Cas6
MDLFSTVIHFRPRQNISGLVFSGRQVQAWFLREVGRHDPDLAAQLHFEGNQSKGDEDDSEGEEAEQKMRPYTLSALCKGPHPVRDLTKNDWCWVRLTSLTKDLSNFLTISVLPNLLEEARIGQAEFDVEPWKKDAYKDPWCGEDTYSNIKSLASRSDENRLVLEFTSLTSFKKKSKFSDTNNVSNKVKRIEKDVPLPIPDMVFGSYLGNWAAFSGEDFPADLGQFIEECLVVNELKICSERVRFSHKNPRNAATGFVGQVRFAILGSENEGHFKANWERYASLVRMLALYSFYCGTGQKTTRGLGQTRLLEPLKRSNQ